MNKKEIIQRKKNIQEVVEMQKDILISDIEDCLKQLNKDGSSPSVIVCLTELQYTFEIFLNNLDRKIKGFTKELEKGEK